MRGMWAAMQYYGRGIHPCLPPKDWPALSRLHWGNPHCPSPAGKDRPPIVWPPTPPPPPKRPGTTVGTVPGRPSSNPIWK
jgi:hypothetical protein